MSIGSAFFAGHYIAQYSKEMTIGQLIGAVALAALFYTILDNIANVIFSNVPWKEKLKNFVSLPIRLIRLVKALIDEQQLKKINPLNELEKYKSNLIYKRTQLQTSREKLSAIIDKCENIVHAEKLTKIISNIDGIERQLTHQIESTQKTVTAFKKLY